MGGVTAELTLEESFKGAFMMGNMLTDRVLRHPGGSHAGSW